MKKHSQRKFIVFSAFVSMLTLTSALLFALSPVPLAPDEGRNLYAIDAPQALETIFQTRVDASGNWKYIYIHHSRTSGATSLSTGDHFVIGNGDGAGDGELQIGGRWDSQQSAQVSGTSIDPACISICLVGDFDQTRPTPTQLRRLAQLVSTLQARYRIAADHVSMIGPAELKQARQASSIAGIGRYFPAAALREQFLP